MRFSDSSDCFLTSFQSIGIVLIATIATKKLRFMSAETEDRNRAMLDDLLTTNERV